MKEINHYFFKKKIIETGEKMNKKKLWVIGTVLLCLILAIFLFFKKSDKSKEEMEISKLSAMVVSIKEDEITVLDDKQTLYTFSISNFKAALGDQVLIEYTGILDSEKIMDENAIIHYSIIVNAEDIALDQWQDNGIFSTYYKLAYKKMKSLTLDEKIGQILLVRYPDNNQIEDLVNYHLGGYVFFAKDFRNKTMSEVQQMINTLQKNSKIPLLTAVDEEGGSVVRVSSNPNLVAQPFASSKSLYSSGGFPKIQEDTIQKSSVLKNLGLNLNLAPVVDVSTNPSDYMYARSLGENTQLTSTYAKTVIQASKGSGVSYTLKHFPGYGNNADTHTGSAVDTRSYDDILQNDLPPFEAGIAVGAEAILVSHNTVNSIDPNNPASLSADVHNLLRDNLHFTGIVITDDLAMGATSNIDNKTVKAILAGNDLIITTDYQEAVREIKNALQNQTLSENLINKLSFRVIAWKYYKGLLLENQK